MKIHILNIERESERSRTPTRLGSARRLARKAFDVSTSPFDVFAR